VQTAKERLPLHYPKKVVEEEPPKPVKPKKVKKTKSQKPVAFTPE
jgi:hypothetical protein